MIIRDHHKPFLQIMKHHIASPNKDYILCIFPADENKNTKRENMKWKIYDAYQSWKDDHLTTESTVKT